APGNAADQTALETGGDLHRRRDRRSARQTLRGRLFPARSESARAGADQQFEGSVERSDQNTGMDGRADETGGAEKARGVSGENRLPGKVARLFDFADRSRSVRAQRDAGREF